MFQDILPPWLLSLLLRHSNTLLASSGYLLQQGSSAHCPFSKIGQFAELHFVNSHYSSPLSAWKGIYLQGSSSKMGLNFLAYDTLFPEVSKSSVWCHVRFGYFIMQRILFWFNVKLQALQVRYRLK